MTMRDCATFDIDDVLGQAEFLCDGEWHGGEGLVDLDALHIAELPSSSLQRLAHGWNRPKPEHPRLNGSDSVGDETGHWFDRSGFREGAIGNDHRRGGAVQTRRVAGRDGSAWRKAGRSLASTSKVVSALGEDCD